VQGYVAAVIGSVDAGTLPSFASDVAAVDDLLADNATLATALTDTAVPGPSRRAVLDDLLRDRVSAPARRVSSFAAGAVPAQDVPAAIGWLAVRVRHAAEGRPGDEPSLGHLAARERVGGFATATFEDLPTDTLDEVEDELFRFARTVESMPALRSALSNVDLPLPSRTGIVDQLLDGKVQPATLRLVRYTLAGGRLRDLLGTLDYLVERTAAARGWRVARIRAGREVDAEQRSRLSESLSGVAGAPVELQVSVDPSLLSGVLVEVGDLRVDATARGRLDHLREHLLTRGWEGSLAEPEPGTDEEGAR
jgi:F-type H+-transporting ATPase subunit delta